MNTQPPLVSFGLIGDPQYADRPPMAGRCYRNALALLAGTVERLNREKLDFVAVPGDLGDGLGTDEIARVIRVLDRSRAPVRYAAGNHDFVLHTEQELARLFNVETLFYNFAVNGVRFHVLNSLEVSRFSPPGSERAGWRRNTAAFTPNCCCATGTACLRLPPASACAGSWK